MSPAPAKNPAELAEARSKSKATWDEMAPGWQQHSDFMWEATRHVGEWMVDKLDPQPGQTILELAAGPGHTGFLAAALVGEEGRLLSTDFSPNMVQVASRRARSLGITNAGFRTMDAEKMDLDNDSVDGILCRFGFMLMLDPDAALTECRRVLRPGGRLAFSVWSGPDKNPWVTLVGLVLVQEGHPPPGDPFGQGGFFSMASEELIKSMVSAAGFTKSEIEEMEVNWSFEDFPAFWTFLTELAGGFAVAIRQLDHDETEKLRRSLQRALEPFRADGGYELRGSTINVVAS